MFLNACWKIESFHAFAKFLMPTKWPMFPTLVLESESHTPITNGYAMNTPSSVIVGARRSAARRRSLSRKRVSPAGLEDAPERGRVATPATLPAPPEIGFFTPYP